MAKLFPTMGAALACVEINPRYRYDLKAQVDLIQQDIQRGDLLIDFDLFQIRFQVIKLLRMDGINIHDFAACVNHLAPMHLGRRFVALYVDFIYFGEF